MCATVRKNMLGSYCSASQELCDDASLKIKHDLFPWEENTLKNGLSLQLNKVVEVFF